MNGIKCTKLTLSLFNFGAKIDLFNLTLTPFIVIEVWGGLHYS